MNKKTLVLGASENPERYSNKAIKMLRTYGHDVLAIGAREGRIDDVIIEKSKLQVQEVNTVTLYLNKNNQQPYEDYLISLKPKRIIFNPGAENNVFAQRANAAGIDTIEACTLVLLSTGQF